MVKSSGDGWKLAGVKVKKLVESEWQNYMAKKYNVSLELIQSLAKTLSPIDKVPTSTRVNNFLKLYFEGVNEDDRSNEEVSNV